MFFTILTFIFFILIEFFLRFIKFKKSGKWEILALNIENKKKFLSFESHPYLGYTKSKNNINPRFPTNNAGFAGSRDVNVSSDLNTVRIVICGGSTVEQNDLDMAPKFDQELTWPKVMEDNLNKSNNEENYEVINAGCGGYTILESTIHLLVKCLPYKPNYAILYHGINDAWCIQAAPDFAPDYTHARKPPVFPQNNGFLSILPNFRISFIYQYSLLYLLQFFEKPSGLLHYISQNYSYDMKFDRVSTAIKTYEDYLTSFCSIALSHNITPILIPWIYNKEMINKPHNINNWDKEKFIELLEINNQSTRRIANETDGVILLELSDNEKDNFRQNDWVHFTKKGLKKVGRDVAIKFLKIHNKKI